MVPQSAPHQIWGRPILRVYELCFEHGVLEQVRDEEAMLQMDIVDLDFYSGL